MAKKKRITRKQLLKEPDEFMTFTGKVIRNTKKYQTQLLYGAGIIVIIILIVFGIRYYANWSEKKAFALLEKAVSKYETIQNSNADPADLKKDFQEILDKYSSKEGGKLARMFYANICYNTGDFDNAIALYKEALVDFKDNPSIKILIQSSLGYAHEAKKDYQAAATYFEKIAEAPDAVAKDEALFNLGRLYGEMGKINKSKEAFKKIVSDYPDSLYIDLVKERSTG